MLYLILASAGFFVHQIDGEPIAGAWVGDGTSWFGFTDASGFYQFVGSEPDSLTVHFTGFEDWTGLKPDNGSTVVLPGIVIDSGQTITVTTTRGSLAGEIPSTESLDGKALAELSTAGMSSLNGRISGVTVREYGGSMPIVSISLRGGDSGQVDHMIDGISVISQRDGMLTGLFDPAVFSSVEIARGGAAPGGSGTGSSGAVNYLPPLASQPVSVKISGLSDGASYISAKYKETGFSLRRNIGCSGTEGYSSTLLTTKNYKNTRLGFLGSWAFGETEGPNWSIPSDGYREQGQIEGWATIYGNKFEVDISSGASLMSFNQIEPSAVDDTHRDLSLRTSFLWKGPVTLRGGFNTTWLESTSTSDHSIQFGTLNAGGEISMFRTSLGCRIDSFSNIHFSGRATASKGVTENIISAEVSAYSDHRSPTVNDLYWPVDGFAAGNPDLKSERTSGAEAGINWNTGFFSGRICGFATTTSNMILWLPDDSGIWSPSNISAALSRGVETSTGFTSGAFSMQTTFTWNLATDETDNTPREGMIIPYRPEYSWGISTVSGLPGGVVGSLSARGVAKRFTNRTQTIFMKEYWIGDASVEREIAAGLSLEIAVQNILDTEYSESNGYPGRGRTFRITAEYTGD